MVWENNYYISKGCFLYFQEMTLHEYAKVLQEKRKALVSLKIEERKVVVDKDFESMQLVERKKEDDFIKLVSSYIS